jgi:hypothetical protein
MDESIFDPGDFDPIGFELANGHEVRVEAGEFWQKLDAEDIRRGVIAEKVYSIRIYCTEDTLPKRQMLCEELRDGHEFTRSSTSEILEALKEHISSRDFLEHDEFLDFLDWFLEMAEEKWGVPEDAVEHLGRLPKVSDPEAFDRTDDSIFTDQS